jgi:hypothetical protein
VTDATALRSHRGGCHCGRVAIEVDAPTSITAYDCNCSMCTRTGYLHLIVPAERFRLLTGNDDITTYTFNTHTAKHHFCRYCGCRPFYVPRSNPDGFSVNVRCLDHATIDDVRVLPFDGQHWEHNADALSDLSRP